MKQILSEPSVQFLKRILKEPLAHFF